MSATGQKFCMECGASLRGVADITGEVPVVDRPRRPTRRARPARSTRAATAATAADRADPVRRRDRRRCRLDRRRRSARRGTAARRRPSPTSCASSRRRPPPVDLSGPVRRRTDRRRWHRQRRHGAGARRRRFRLRPLLVLALFAAGATVVARAHHGHRDRPAARRRRARVRRQRLRHEQLRRRAARRRRRWSSARSPGASATAGAPGWPAAPAPPSPAGPPCCIGLAEWRHRHRRGRRRAADDHPRRRLLGAAGGRRRSASSCSSARSPRRAATAAAGLDPWIAALGAVSFLIAAGGPLIPEGTADWSGNCNSDTLGVELPTLFFVGRAVQLGLLALCGVVGFLLVRRCGLGLAVGSAVAAGWLLVTAATDQTPSPIGPAYENPGSLDLQPHAVTIVGFALVGFFALVAVVMALLDADR